MIQCIDGKKFRDMFVSGANNLQNNKDLVDKFKGINDAEYEYLVKQQALLLDKSAQTLFAPYCIYFPACQTKYNVNL